MVEPLSEGQFDPCGKKFDASCIPWNGPVIPCLNICKTDSLQDVMVKEGNLLCQIVTDLNTLENPPTPPVIDFSKLDLKCLYQSTITTWTCPCVGQTFYPDSSAPNGVGYCQICPTPSTCALTTCTPVATVTPNPVPAPNTLLGILQLILNKVPCCDPCTVRLCCEAPYTWLSPAATGNPGLYPNGACAQSTSPSTINPLVIPFKC